MNCYRDRTSHAAILISLAVLPLSACGGGSTPLATASTTPPPAAPVPVPPPPPPPPPPASVAPLPTAAEYGASAGAVAARAGYAYEQGYTGKGVTIAFIDSGIAGANPEFAGRISSASKSFGTSNTEDVQGHGTRVASIAVAAANDARISGVAHEATILAIKIAAVDNGKEVGFNGLNIDNAINHAVSSGAFVINLSTNGTSNSSGNADLRSAMNAVRQADRLLVQSVQNEAGDSFAGTISQAMVGSDMINKSWFLYGLGLDASLNPVAGNGSPGALADRTLSVAAWGVNAVTPDGSVEKVYGNSFAAPVVAGAAALLKQYWSQLGGKEISSILLSSARDAGAPGADPVYGAGILDIEAAFKARNPTLAASVTVTPSSVAGTNLAFSAPFGSSGGAQDFGQAAGTAIALDAYGRDYGVRVGALTSASRSGISLAGLAVDGARALRPAERSDPRLGFASSLDGRTASASTGRFAFGLGKSLAISGLVNGSIETSEGMTGSILRASGLPTYGSAFEFASGSRGIAFGTARSFGPRGSASTRRFGLTLGSGISLGMIDSVERGSALGLRGTGAFAIQGAQSRFATLGWSGELLGLRLNGQALAGRTHVRGGDSLIAFTGPILSTGFHLDASRPLLGGSALFGLTSPLKVERARLRYTRAIGYDRDARALIDATSLIDLAPQARELDLELGWTRSFANSWLGLGTAYGLNSGNAAGRRSAGAWLRYGRSF